MKLGAADYLIKDAPPAGDPAHAGARAQRRRRSSARTRASVARSAACSGFGELIGTEPEHAGGVPADRRRQPEPQHRAADRRERHRQGAGRADDPPARPAARRALSSPSTAPGSPRRCSTASSSATAAAPSPAPSPITTACSAPPTGGTLLLDEVAEIPSRAAGEVPARHPGARGHAARIEPAGSRSSVRLIAATNRDLEAEVRAGPLPARPLLPAERRPHRAAAAARRGATTSRRSSTTSSPATRAQYEVAPKRIAPEALARAGRARLAGQHPRAPERHRACLRALGRRRHHARPTCRRPCGAAGGGPAPRRRRTPSRTLADAERQLIAAALRQASGNKNEAARLLGIDRQRLYRKIEKYGL